MRVFRKPKFWLCAALTALLALLLFLPVKNVLGLMAIQAAVQRDWEIDFLDSTNPSASSVPAMLPDRLDRMAQDFFSRLYDETHDYTSHQQVKTRNRDMVMMDRFHALFRGPIEKIGVYYFEKFQGDLGAGLARFPELREVIVHENEIDGPTEAEWRLLCTRLRTLPHLERLEIGGPHLTDESIAPLAGHPQLRRIEIDGGSLTAGCTQTFASIPHLSELCIGSQIYEGKTWLSPEERKAMIAALPNVKVELEGDDE
jgi:hypothetical protein